MGDKGEKRKSCSLRFFGKRKKVTPSFFSLFPLAAAAAVVELCRRRKEGRRAPTFFLFDCAA